MKEKIILPLVVGHSVFCLDKMACLQTVTPQLTHDMPTDYNKSDGGSPTTRKLTGHKLRKTQSPLSLRPPYPPTYTLPTYFFTNIILMTDKHNIRKGKMHSNCKLLPDHLVCKSHK